MKKVNETASAGGTSAGAIATSVGGSIPSGQFFGGDPSSSIYGTIKKNRSKRKKVKEAAKTAKTPQKPSGKSEIIGSSKPYKEPHVLGPTDKVKSVGKILGGKPKKNPTLSTKSFGTCSANNDPGSKSILGEIKVPFNIPALASEDFFSEWMEMMWKELRGIKPNKISSQDVLDAAHRIAFETFAPKIRSQMVEVLNTLFLKRADGIAKFQKSKHNVTESITYKEFRNARNAETRVCPTCGTNFKNVHSADQKFCSKNCEDDATTVRLKEAWERPMQTEFETKDGKIVDLDTVAKLVKRVMDDGKIGKLQACLFVSGMFKNCTGWTIIFALEDYAKESVKKAEQKEMINKLES